VSGVSKNKEEAKMPKKIDDIGKPEDVPPGKREHRLHGGETWTLINNPAHVIGLKKDDRLRIEKKGANVTMYPDEGTGLYTAGYEEIDLTVEEKHPPDPYDLYSFTGLLNGSAHTLYFAEGSDIASAEAGIWTSDPREEECIEQHEKGGGGGTAGLRR